MSALRLRLSGSNGDGGISAIEVDGGARKTTRGEMPQQLRHFTAIPRKPKIRDVWGRNVRRRKYADEPQRKKAQAGDGFGSCSHYRDDSLPSTTPRRETAGLQMRLSKYERVRDNQRWQLRCD